MDTRYHPRQKTPPLPPAHLAAAAASFNGQPLVSQKVRIAFQGGVLARSWRRMSGHSVRPQVGVGSGSHCASRQDRFAGARRPCLAGAPARAAVPQRISAPRRTGCSGDAARGRSPQRVMTRKIPARRSSPWRHKSLPQKAPAAARGLADIRRVSQPGIGKRSGVAENGRGRRCHGRRLEDASVAWPPRRQPAVRAGLLSVCG